MSATPAQMAAAPAPEASRPAAGEWTPPPIDWETPQLTIRAVLTGMVLGGLLSICNIYTSMRIGWSMNMSVPGVLISFGFWMALANLFRRLRPWGILENNICQTACSAAAAISSAGLVAPIPALTMLDGTQLSYLPLVVWTFSVCIVGIAIAVVLRRQMLEVDRLPFPSGVATAVTLREIYATGREGLIRVQVLIGAGLFAALVKLLEIFVNRRTGKPVAIELPGTVGGFSLAQLQFVLNPTLLMVAVGGLIGLRAAVSLMIGAVLGWLVLAPWLLPAGYIKLKSQERLAAMPAGVAIPPDFEVRLRYSDANHRLQWIGVMTPAQRDALLALSTASDYQEAIRRLYVNSQLDPSGRADDPRFAEQLAAVRAAGAYKPVRPNFTDLLEWLLWPGVTLMVVSSLVSFGMSWRAALRAFRFSGSRDAPGARSAEVSVRWLLAGAVAVTLLATATQIAFFGIQWWAALLGVLLSFVLAIVATRVSGETNSTPIGAMGKVTQLVFGVLVPKNAAANLMTANVTGGAASQCADLMHDLKTGYLLGAQPRNQVVAQVCGALAGALLGSAFYLVLFPDPRSMLLTDEWPAPAVAAWKAVAEIFSIGLQALPAGTPLAMLIAAVLGVVLPVLEATLPRDWRTFVPSAASLGLAFVVRPQDSISMFAGGVLITVLGKVIPSLTARFAITVCAGAIAGDSLTGAGDAVVKIFEGTK